MPKVMSEVGGGGGGGGGGTSKGPQWELSPEKNL